MSAITVILADDHPIVRQGLRHLLENDPGFNVVGEAGDGIETMRLVENSKPHVLVVDMMMPGLNGLEVLRQTKKIVAFYTCHCFVHAKCKCVRGGGFEFGRGWICSKGYRSQ